jgi:DmsE family decaheme c-type cytochrome
VNRPSLRACLLSRPPRQAGYSHKSVQVIILTRGVDTAGTTMVIVRSKICWAFLVCMCAFMSAALTPDQAYGERTRVNAKKCLKCHPDLGRAIASERAHTPFKKFECSTCHNPHTSNYQHLVKEQIGKLCRGCHEDKKGAFDKEYSHPPFKEGACLKCHDPHSSKNRKLLRVDRGELCFSCHAEKEIISKKHKHEPVKKGECLTCHSPHTSDHEAMLKRSVTQACVSCHSERVRGEKAKKSHGYYPVRNTQCTSCHNPHASSRKNLVKESSHKPFAQKKCTQCHNSAQSRDPLGVKGEGISVCTACHPSVKKDFRKVNTHVGRGIFCTNCHSPHTSDQGRMKKAREAKICATCHEDTRARLRDEKNKHKHPLVIKGKCSGCHRPHGSNFRLFFGADEIAACTDSECHKRHATFTHPIGKDAVDPRSKGEITCITCHNLMGSRHDFSLRFDRKKQLCIQCHKGY